MHDLTSEQEAAFAHSKGPACVIAGAGTGKTATLIERVVFLVEQRQIEPSRIVVTTFTRKATAELYARTFARIGEVAQKLRISTIDALIWNLANEAMHRGMMRSARLIGEANQRVLLLDCAWEVFGKGHTRERASWADEADDVGLMGLMEKTLRAETTDSREEAKLNKHIGEKLTKLGDRRGGRSYHKSAFWIPSLQDLKQTVTRYFERLEELSATDYDLLTREFLRCLKQDNKLATEFASQIDSVIVDEFQDTSRVQAEILLLLSGKTRQIWIVGDPCQQIYEWRGAGQDNMPWFIKKTKAQTYFLTQNWRSTQPILDCAHSFLKTRVPALEDKVLLKRLVSQRDSASHAIRHPIYSGTLEKTLLFVFQLLIKHRDLKPSDIAILSRKLTRQMADEIQGHADVFSLKLQFHSTRADKAMKETIVSPPSWKAGSALEKLYEHDKIQTLISSSLLNGDFSELRRVRPLAAAAEALDSTLPPNALSFKEAWPALKTTQDREVEISSAVGVKSDAIQVMTIHAAKGLEFPIVILAKLGKGSQRSFPNPKDDEECRLAYVGATRARDLLILAHTLKKPHETLKAFGDNVVPIRGGSALNAGSRIEAPSILPPPMIISATNLDLYEQCPLKFAACHEGRLLPKWSVPASAGSRLHKALEYYLRAGIVPSKSIAKSCFQQGYRDGDSPLRKLPRKTIKVMSDAYKQMTSKLIKTSPLPLAIEQRYRYVQESGQVEGIIDAVVVQDGQVVLKEWKSSSEITANRKRSYTLQASAGALGFQALGSPAVDLIEIVPVLAPSKRVTLQNNSNFVDQTKSKLDKVFRDLRDRNCRPQRGNDCKSCDLKKHCPAWVKTRG